MKTKIIILALALFFLLPLASALGFNVAIEPVKDHITENQVAVFNLQIENNGGSDRFEIFTFNTDFVFPEIVMPITSGESKSKQIKFFPQVKRSGIYEVTLFVKSQTTGEIKETKARIRLFTFEDALWIKVEPELLHVQDKKIDFVVKNIADVTLDSIKIHTESPIFSKDFTFSLGPRQKKKFQVDVDLSKAEGGVHHIQTKVYDEGKLAFEKQVPYNLELIYDFQQSKSLTGFLIRQKKFTFENKGNTREEIDLKENSTILEKIFSYFSERPLFTTEAGAVKADWKVEVGPYEKKEIIVKTNYLLPLILLALVIVGFAFTINYQSRGILVTKTASRAKSNKGTAFKVAIKVKNRKEAVRDVRVRDFLPKGLKVHEKFDFVKPNKIESNYLEWHLPLMHGGEERVFTYYLYTEDEFSGALLLPHTVVNYLTLHRDPKSEYSQSVRIEPIRKIKVSGHSEHLGHSK
ncbi:hypothetical protein B6U80_01720 [Candidatus Pacearchaeota archaeon ex4484_26]|nr:MAG: hypothetical protein B6U80_01720 [Candidatus Pacearchaeota archaeon ex4484_26]